MMCCLYDTVTSLSWCLLSIYCTCTYFSKKMVTVPEAEILDKKNKKNWCEGPTAEKLVISISTVLVQHS